MKVYCIDCLWYFANKLCHPIVYYQDDWHSPKHSIGEWFTCSRQNRKNKCKYFRQNMEGYMSDYGVFSVNMREVYLMNKKKPLSEREKTLASMQFNYKYTAEFLYDESMVDELDSEGKQGLALIKDY